SLKYCFIGYGGGEGSANIHVWDNDVDIEHNTIMKSKERGIYVDNASPNISYNLIKNNLTEGILTANGALPYVKNNNIINNTNYGVYNYDASVTVDATNNWWGDASGPYHADTNPTGIGNGVSDHVLFNPWYQSPVDLSTAIDELKVYGTIKGIWPNPLSSNSQVTYQIKTAGRVLMRVFDQSGRTVLSLIDAYQFPGEYTIDIDGTKLVNGIYLLSLETANTIQIQKIIKQ
ncbi:MAG: T9SS type A sorting domain-containing protein, partial [Bacteroidales bacterium]|nr:T9SS type A sorting domain-containing protein [Bacteroidales bacterium]